MAHSNKSYRFAKYVGHGGVDCPCCRHRRESKADKVQAVNRAARRAGKKEARDAAASE